MEKVFKKIDVTKGLPNIGDSVITIDIDTIVEEITFESQEQFSFLGITHWLKEVEVICFTPDELKELLVNILKGEREIIEDGLRKSVIDKFHIEKIFNELGVEIKNTF